MRKRSMPKKISNSFPISYELNANIRPRFIWCCKLANFPQKVGVLRKILGPTDFFPQKVGVLRKTVAFAEAAATVCSVQIQDQGRRIFLPWSR